MSDTPETDKNLWDHGDEIDPSMRPDSNGNWVPEEFARKLERERDEAREQNAKLRYIAERAIDYLDKSYRNGFEDEANELRAELDQLKEGGE